MAEDFDAGMRKHCGHFLRISGQHSSGNEEGAVAMRRGFQPRFEREMHALAHGRIAGEEHGEAASRIRDAREIGKASLVVEAVTVFQELLARKAAVHEGFYREVGSAKQKVSALVLLFFAREDVFLEGIFVVRRQLHADALGFFLYGFVCALGRSRTVGMPSLAATFRVLSAASGQV